MPEPFKNFFNRPLIEEMGRHLGWQSPEFDADRFVALAAHELDALELKQRSAQITEALVQTLPADFMKAADLVEGSLAPVVEGDRDSINLDELTTSEGGIAGWPIMPMTEWVGLYGQGHMDRALDLMAALTQRFSSEFGIRHLIVADQAAVLDRMALWATSPSHHVRRLVSEGARPRLPWGIQLKAFVKDPTPPLPLLEMLKDDPSEYVRRSVANHLNDIAKDHPDVAAEVGARWLAQADTARDPRARQRMVKHALRTLIKQGHPEALKALGYGPPVLELADLTVKTPTVTLGGALEFAATLKSTSESDQPLVVDFVVHHKKANGATTPKVFKWKTLTLKAGATATLEKRHPMKVITTRKYYAGGHGVEVQVNGVSVGRAEFELKVPAAV